MKRLHNSYCVVCKVFSPFWCLFAGHVVVRKKVCLNWQGVYVLLGRWFYWYSRIGMKILFYFDNIWKGYNSWSINVIELGLDTGTYLGWKYILYFFPVPIFMLFIYSSVFEHTLLYGDTRLPIPVRFFFK
jgi:hypothetical protein